MTDEIGEIFHIGPPITVRAVQLTEDADWEAIAEWCGGELVNREQGDSGEYETELRIPQPGFDPQSRRGWLVIVWPLGQRRSGWVLGVPTPQVAGDGAAIQASLGHGCGERLGQVVVDAERSHPGVGHPVIVPDVKTSRLLLSRHRRRVIVTQKTREKIMGLTKMQQKFLDEMKRAVADRRWTRIPSDYGFTIRWQSEDRMPRYPELVGWRSSYNAMLFLTMCPKPILGCSTAPWSGRSDCEISYRRALEILAMDDPESAVRDPCGRRATEGNCDD